MITVDAMMTIFTHDDDTDDDACPPYRVQFNLD